MGQASNSTEVEAFEKVLTATLQRVLDFLRFAEAKNGALLTLASAWSLAIITLVSGTYPWPGQVKQALALALVPLGAAIATALLSFLPKTNLRRMLRKAGGAPPTPNLLFFGDIASFNPGEFLPAVRSRYLARPSASVRHEYLSDLCVQIVVVSQITDRKLRLFRYGLAGLGMAAALPTVAVLLNMCPWTKNFVTI